MELKRFTMIMGILFLAIGILGFVPRLLTYPFAGDPVTPMDHGYLFGLFAVNAIHNVVHMLFGVWGLAASQDIFHARRFCKANAVIYAVLAVMGLIPVLNTVFGLMPIFGHDIWLHGLIAVMTGYFGYAWDMNQSFKKPSSTDRAA